MNLLMHDIIKMKDHDYRNFGRVTVAKQLVRNEEGRGLTYTWRAIGTPLGSLPSVHQRARMSISRRGAQL
jgi:hypothetical protein